MRTTPATPAPAAARPIDTSPVQAMHVEDAFQVKANNCLILTERLAQAIAQRKHDAPCTPQPGLHWGHVGDLGHLEAQLAEALSFLGQLSEEEAAFFRL